MLLPQIYERESLGARRAIKAFVERGKQNPIADFALQIETAGELDRISRSQSMPQEQRLGLSG